MCGIAGVIGEETSSSLEYMLVKIKHRGPDGAGVFSYKDNHLGSTRLSIVDLGAPAGPYVTRNGKTAIVFNGEIYNHHEIRRRLKTKGYHFDTETDTEVVLLAYKEYGEHFVEHLDGMFALAIMDQSTLILARDRLGIKPLYYAVWNNTLFFSSELKAILQVQKKSPSLCLQALSDFFLLGFATGEQTFFDGIKSLMPGNLLICETSIGVKRLQVKRYCHLLGRTTPNNLEHLEDKLMELLFNAVNSHLKADVDIGISLSGGLDSSILALIAKEISLSRLTTFSIGDKPLHPDLTQAQILAKKIGSDHHQFIVEGNDFDNAIPGYIASQEAPMGLSGVSVYLLSEKISKFNKVCLIGEGADELFGGYPEYLNPYHKFSEIAKRLSLLSSNGMLPSDATLHSIATLLDADRNKQLTSAMIDFGLADQMERLHLNLIDKAAMAFGVEMRVPFLDRSFYEFAMSIPADLLVRKDLGVSKYILKKSALKRFKTNIEDAVLRRKAGIPSAIANHRSAFENRCERRLPNDYLKTHPMGFAFKKAADLFIFEIFEEIFIHRRGDVSALPDINEFLTEKATCR